ncbi:Dihydrofolate reductase [Eumeta japonica]|uniref:dihydrofolate reductase n=1 Tax=Eumeta variegata TaxID=151549 RepID=A0A4C1ZMN6_EUMVA|nr:Dihydrofolate reductase [Eumeta japonica]
MSKVKLNLIAAACENMGIGVKGTLPWRLKYIHKLQSDTTVYAFRKEMAYFTTMTTKVTDENKVNAVIMGRRTWECIPPKYRPLPNRVNIVLTHHTEKLQPEVPEGVVVVPGIEEAISHIEGRDDIENAWVIGGSSVYRAAMDHPNCGKIYLTEIQKSFDCDTFFPDINRQEFKLVNEEEVPEDRQTEENIDFFLWRRRELNSAASVEAACVRRIGGSCGLHGERARSRR